MVAQVKIEKVLMGNWGSEITPAELENLTPPRSRTHSPDHPLDSAKGLQMVAQASGIELSEPRYIASTKKDKFLTLWGANSADWNTQIGGLDVTRTLCSIDDWSKSIAKSVFCGETFQICDNGMVFGAEIAEKTKQTKNLQDREWSLYFRFLRGLTDLINHSDKVYRHYKNVDVSDSEAHDIFCQMVLQDIANPAAVGELLHHWHKPEQDEYKDRNAASILQSFTARNRGRSMWKAAERDGKCLDIIDIVTEHRRPILEATPCN